MNESSSYVDFLDLFSGVLIRSFVIGVVFVTVWFLFFLIGGDAGYAIHAKLFQISRHEYDLLNYCGMAFVKVCNILLFLFPYIAVRMTLRRRKA